LEFDINFKLQYVIFKIYGTNTGTLGFRARRNKLFRLHKQVADIYIKVLAAASVKWKLI
jgi:hypothetical protein